MSRLRRLRLELLSTDPRCTYCRRDLDPAGRGSSLDHLIPKSKGGTNRRRNLALACGRCNRLRGAMTYDELLTWCDRVLTAVAQARECVTEGGAR